MNGQKKNKLAPLEWQQLARQFGNLAREEQEAAEVTTKTKFITEGKELGVARAQELAVLPGLLRAYRDCASQPESTGSNAQIARWGKERTAIEQILKQPPDRTRSLFLRKWRKATNRLKELKTEPTPEHLEIIKSRVREAKSAESALGLKTWELGDGINPDFKERVRHYIAEAGRALPDCPNDANPEDFWLDQLWLFLRKHHSAMTYTVSNDVGMIHSVCVGSGELCRSAKLGGQISIGENRDSDDTANAADVETKRHAKQPGITWDEIKHRPEIKVAILAKGLGVAPRTIGNYIKRQTLNRSRHGWVKVDYSLSLFLRKRA